LTTKDSQSTTEPRHWSNETAAAAVQAAIVARALMLATALALGLVEEQVERAPQAAARLRLACDAQSELLITATEHATCTATQLAQAQEQIRELEAERDAAVEALLATDVDVEPASGNLVQLAYQVAEWVRHARAALVEIRDEAEGDFDRDTIITAARGALRENDD